MSDYDRKITLKDLKKANKAHPDGAAIVFGEKIGSYEAAKRSMKFVPLKLKLATGELVDIRYEFLDVVNSGAAKVNESEDNPGKPKTTITFKKVERKDLVSRFVPQKVSLTNEERELFKQVDKSKIKEFLTKIGITAKKIPSYTEELSKADDPNTVFDAWLEKQAKKDKNNDEQIDETVKATNEFVEFNDLLCDMLEKRIRSFEEEVKSLPDGKAPLFVINQTDNEKTTIFLWKKSNYKDTKTGKKVEFDKPVYKIRLQSNSDGIYHRTFTRGGKGGKGGQVVSIPLIKDANGDEAKFRESESGPKVSISTSMISDYITRLSTLAGKFELRQMTVFKLGVSFDQQFNPIIVRRNPKPYSGSDEATKKLANSLKKRADSDEEDEDVVLPRSEAPKPTKQDKPKSSRAIKTTELVDSEDEGQSRKPAKSERKKEKPKSAKSDSEEEEPAPKSKKPKEKAKPKSAKSDSDEDPEPAPKSKKPKEKAKSKPDSGSEDEAPTPAPKKGKGKAKPESEDD